MGNLGAFLAFFCAPPSPVRGWGEGFTLVLYLVQRKKFFVGKILKTRKFVFVFMILLKIMVSTLL
jgi:hypothetical protein